MLAKEIPSLNARRSTKERLLISAEELFAERGYNGVSVRDIAARADVTVGSIRHHFGSKEDLLQAVFQRLVVPLREERKRRLALLLKNSQGRALDVHEILRAVLEPIFRLSRENETYRKLIARASTDPTIEIRRAVDRTFEKSKWNVHRFLRNACPHLSDSEFSWRYFCYYGAMQYILADVGHVQMIVGKRFDTSRPEVALKYVIPFLAAGFLAPSMAE